LAFTGHFRPGFLLRFLFPSRFGLILGFPFKFRFFRIVKGFFHFLKEDFVILERGFAFFPGKRRFRIRVQGNFSLRFSFFFVFSRRNLSFGNRRFFGLFLRP
jgi:hypothetical protein